MVRVLLEFGADVNGCVVDKKPLLAKVIEQKDSYKTDIIPMLLKAGMFTEKGIASSGPWESYRKSYFSALGCAIEQRDDDLVHLLLEHGAVVNSNGGWTNPVGYASYTVNLPILELLRKHGGDLSMKDRDGSPAFFQALYAPDEKRSEVFQFFLNHGVDLNQTDTVCFDSLYMNIVLLSTSFIIYIVYVCLFVSFRVCFLCT